MKRLFIIRRGRNGAVVLGDDKQPLYFQSKTEAKVTRESLGGGFVVSVGIDHKLYKGVK
jgi:hypothetical protein